MARRGAATAAPEFAVDDDGWVSGVRRILSPNCDKRPAGAAVRLVVVHAISLPPGEFGGEGIERLFTNTLDARAHPYYRGLEGLRVSAHFLVRRDGEPIQFVACDQRAWHAGLSSWRGVDRCNDYSVGVELEGDDERAFERSQYLVLAAIIGALARRYDIEGIAGHVDIAPSRKTDPGPRFDWTLLRALLARPRRER